MRSRFVVAVVCLALMPACDSRESTTGPSRDLEPLEDPSNPPAASDDALWNLQAGGGITTCPDVVHRVSGVREGMGFSQAAAEAQAIQNAEDAMCRRARGNCQVGCEETGYTCNTDTSIIALTVWFLGFPGYYEACIAAGGDPVGCATGAYGPDVWYAQAYCKATGKTACDD